MVFSTFCIQDSGLLIGSHYQVLDCYFLILRKLTHTLILPRYLWGLEAEYRSPVRKTTLRENGYRWCIRWRFAVVFADVTYMFDL